MPGTPKALPSTTLAVLRPTPGSVTRSSSRPGTSPSNPSTQPVAQRHQRSRLGPEEPGRPDDLLQLLRVRLRHAPRVGYARTAAGVVWLTLRSVVCADSTVATSSSNGLRKSSSACAYGYCSASALLIRRARRFRRQQGLPRTPRPGAFGPACSCNRLSLATGAWAPGLWRCRRPECWSRWPPGPANRVRCC